MPLALVSVLSAGLLAVLFPTTGDGYPRDWAVDILHYCFHLTLTDANDGLEGMAEITVLYREDGVEEFFLDLVGRSGQTGTGMEVSEVTREGRAVAHLHADDRLRVSLVSPSKSGEQRTYIVNYRGVPGDGLIIGQNKFGDRTFFGDNWPDRARHWLPTVDHVSDKATVEWMVTAPEHYEVIGNGRLVERSDLGNGRELTHWASLVPLAPKVMVIGVARFAMKNTGYVSGIPIQAWVYPENRTEGFHDYALAERAVRFLELHVGPFPYAKLANVQSKTRYGGMENASNVFYHEGSVRGDRSIERLIVHEVAHQWFGDSVTEKDWHHLWLSEGFATYFTHLYNELTHGRDEREERMRQDRERIIDFFAREPELALIPTQLSDPMEMLNTNAYQKGSWLLHMLRRQVGDDAFLQGIRLYYRSFRDGIASTEDLRAVMEEVSGQELGWFFDQWARRPGHPVLEAGLSFEPDGGVATVALRQVQGGDEPFRIFLDLGFQGSGEVPVEIRTVEVTQREQSFAFSLEEVPETLILDPDAWLLFEQGAESGRRENQRTEWER
jgi:aminopeptidase N